MSEIIAESVRDNPLCPICKSPSYYEALCNESLVAQKAEYERTKDEALRTHEKKLASREKRGDVLDDDDREFRFPVFVAGSTFVGPYSRMRPPDLRDAVEPESKTCEIGCGTPRNFRVAYCNKCGCSWLRHIEIVRG